MQFLLGYVENAAEVLSRRVGGGDDTTGLAACSIKHNPGVPVGFTGRWQSKVSYIMDSHDQGTAYTDGDVVVGAVE